MSNLKDKKCVPCEGGIIPFDISEIHKYQKMVDGWDIFKGYKTNFFSIEKDFKFNNFIDIVKSLLIKLGKFLKNEGHHPDIICLVGVMLKLR